jgi:hypothetical protein
MDDETTAANEAIHKRIGEVESKFQATIDDVCRVFNRRLDASEAGHKEIYQEVRQMFNELRPKLESLGVTPQIAKLPASKRRPAIIEDAPSCPEHPDAPQTAGGCTAPGCTFAPPAQGQAPQPA